MPGNINTPGQPRVFISYARADGEHYAQSLRKRIEKEYIPLWQDRVSLEGGRDWWLQIEEALDHVEFMVMVMTPAALQSPIVRKEWRTARQKGVCVYPIKADANIDFTSLPRWMRDIHWYDPDREWTKFVNDLNTRCEQKRVPFMVEELPDDFVESPEESEALINLLLDSQREEPVAITAALRGAGGYGKTTMARAICHNDRIQEAFDDGLLWVTLGENPGDLVGKVKDLIYILSHESPGLSGIDAATAHLAELLANRDILLVIDDVWNGAHLRPFLQGGERCARLVTTRDEGILPRVAQRIQVDAMRQDQAVQLLCAGLDDVPRSVEETKELYRLAARLGEWPLLLTLVNSALRERIDRGQPLRDALNYINKVLERRGLTAFDAQNAHERRQAVSKTFDVSFDLLSANDSMRFKELAIFPEDTDIPLVTVQTLWSATGGLDDIDTEDTCARLYRLSLLLRYDLAMRTIRLHDVVRTYLKQEVGKEGLQNFHNQLLNAYGCKVWSDLPHDEPYLWDHLAEHLIGARRIDELVATVKDGRYLVAKTYVSSVYTLEVDLNMAEQHVPTDTTLRLLKRSVTRMSHILARCQEQSEVAVVLYGRLIHLQELVDVCATLEQELYRPYLIPWHLLPDLKHVALIRTLSGHTDRVLGCAISPMGDFIVSASEDNTLKVWDTHSGLERLTLFGHLGGVNGCAVSPMGDFIVSASDDETLKIWDVHSGIERLTLSGHSGGVNGCAISPMGDFVVSASSDKTLKVWDAHSGIERFTLSGHTDWVRSCAVSPTGDFIVSASNDKTLKIWDVHSGIERLTLTGHTDWVIGCAISPTGDFIISASFDKTLKIWDALSGIERLILSGHTIEVCGCAISPTGDFIVSASGDATLKVWDANSGVERLTLTGHTNIVWGCAISPVGDFIVSASDDETLKVWDAQAGTDHLPLTDHTDWVIGCAVSPVGDFIVSVSYDKTLKIWDAASGSERFTLTGHTDGVTCCAISPMGDFIVSASDDRTLKIWDVHSGVERLTLTGHTDQVWGCAISPMGDFIVSASYDKTLKIWDVHSGVERLTLSGHTDQVNGCAISPMGDFIVSASEDNTLKVWDTHSGVERLTLSGHTDKVLGCAISPMGDFIVSASFDETLKIWDAHSGVERLTLTGHTDGVNGCAISPMGDFIASTSMDKTIKLWDAHSGVCLTTLSFDNFLTACTFCPDGKHIVAVGDSGVYFLQLIV